jgi:hypothetical protein
MILPSTADTVQTIDHGCGTPYRIPIDVPEKNRCRSHQFLFRKRRIIGYDSISTSDFTADDAASGGKGAENVDGDSQDYLHEKTKWVFWNYIQGI